MTLFFKNYVRKKWLYTIKQNYWTRTYNFRKKHCQRTQA